MAANASIMGARRSPPLKALYVLANRAEIEAEIERLVAILDAADGDVDLEPEQDVAVDHDDGCGSFVIEGKRLWGIAEDRLGLAVPIYGEDQDTLPLGREEAFQEAYAKDCGLERSPTGGWRQVPATREIA